MDDVAILHEDNSVLVVVKPQNLPSQADKSGDIDLLTLLKDYIKTKYDKPGEAYLGLVHRLDRPTGGVMVFAKNSKSAARLSADIATGEMNKNYLTVVNNAPKDRKGTLVNYLKKNTMTNTVYVATFGTTDAKRAELSYEVLENYHNAASLLKVNLGTGRSHQIRVQFAALGCPVYGDVRYGGDILGKGNLALWAYQLAFNHPVTKDRMVFVAYPPESEPWTKFDVAKYIEHFSNNDDEDADFDLNKGKVYVASNIE
jgi:23S rRNA pseudouridine1911/1915/1917 synthase